MENSVHELKRNVQILLKFLENKNPNLGTIDPVNYTHRVDRSKDQLGRYYETTTPKYQLSKFGFDCIGRLKFHNDKKLYLYLEVEETPPDDDAQSSVDILWPVKCTWKVEIIDENGSRRCSKTSVMGEASCVFNKPQQGRTSRPNDWISYDLGDRSNHCSITFRWTVAIEPLLNGICVNDFKNLLENFKENCDHYEGSETLLSDLKKNVEKLLMKEYNNGDKISKLESEILQTNTDLAIIEKNQEEIKELIKRFSPNLSS